MAHNPEIAPWELGGSLEQSLSELAQDFATPHCPIDVSVDVVDPVAPDLSMMVYRVARELLRNAIDHGRPRSIQVTLKDRQDQLRLEVHDDGDGFDPQVPAPAGHHGLQLIRHTVSDHGGQLNITSSSAGTLVEVMIPSATPS